MGCESCGQINGENPKGCQSKGNCLTGGCTRKNAYDWLSRLDLHDPMDMHIVEVSFKNGSRTDFYLNADRLDVHTGDQVVVESNGGTDLGRINLSGELVRLQMKKKKIHRDAVHFKVLRLANTRDLEKLASARKLEHQTLVQARVISKSLGLDMKIGDIEYRADKRKATFYYTAEGRVDFRELVKSYAQAFKVKVEMRQIGVRQESARIGGIGSCGRELCCSTWLSDFKSVSTSAARYQNIAINQTKLSGQCGRLKCCLNYELDTYMDALKGFPKKADYLLTEVGKARLMKMDIFKGLMFYAYVNNERGMALIPLSKERAIEIQSMNKKGLKPEELIDKTSANIEEAPTDFDDNLTGVIDLPPEQKKRRKSRKKRRPKQRNPKTANKSGQKRPNTKSKRKYKKNKHQNITDK